MDHQIFKIYNQEDFNRITRGIKVAQCMQSRSSSVSESERMLGQLDDLVVSDSLSCSFCNTVFENKTQQRLHYKLDWHRYNLKQRLNGLKPINEDKFSLLADEGNVSSLSGSDVDSENEDETSEAGSGHCETKTLIKNKKIEKKGKNIESVSDSSDTEYSDDIIKEKKVEALLVTASRHSKVFFENDDGNIFSIYRCLLHNKKDIPEVDNDMITQALNRGKETTWTVIMIGGGHFAAAVFQNGEPIVHKTFHSYTVRAKQGFAQSSRTATNHAKSAGASLRRYNEASLLQHVQDILESWSSHINNSSLILYRAVGPYNRTVLFGGKNPPLDKNDLRLRPLPFPTRRATFSEVKRVYDVLSSMEIYGSASDFTDSFPISPRQPLRKKVSKTDGSGEILVENVECNAINSTCNLQDSDKNKVSVQPSPERQHKNSRSHIDRAKPRKSPCRPLPDIVARLAQSSSESELDSQISTPNIPMDVSLIEQELEIEFNENLLAFQDTVPRYMKNKKIRRQRKKTKKDECVLNETLTNAKVKLWSACKLGDDELLSSVINDLLIEVKKSVELENKLENEEDVTVSCNTVINKDDVTKLVNDPNEDGNTMLHVAALGGHLKLVWQLMEIGSDPCNKNKKLQTPYAAANDKETRNIFRRFMGANPDKFNYNKSQIPGPLTDEIEQEELEKKKQQRKVKREKDRVKRKEFELKKREEDAKQRYLNLSDREKRALAAEQRILEQGCIIISRCFQCGVDMAGQVPFEYNSNRFCSMPCLKEHRLRNKVVI
ncbi:ankyrin repeat and zinc finger domain-containing protein 1-like [Frieseomelitta varia]|uniref:ankyrin repeat and zinc finger domain-containing protein 1-like n=1 Tax=Frieseomelitta varia TaxID=561572 RepID=UPI001CB6953B|nr:ankyrin repeat and zinc finger domain-containing protein 1-like [Frieseomelitta varia]XP_043520850.1 ankyrin repeat and zinc finger domain-containing protein 1-like [Frieseomelitta varia]XP_043520851.1 ankyrin repeat and zinc finger domain-containing protein 1-like [Frieseomelitta varia]